MTARAALAGGLSLILAERRAAALALACGATGALVLHGGSAASARVWALGGHKSAALGLWVMAGTLAAVLLGAGLASLLSAMANNRAANPLRASLQRGVAMLSLVAVERFMGAMLALGTVIAWVELATKQDDAPPAHLAALATLAAAPVLLAGVIAVPAFRVAATEAGAGEVSWLALANGLRYSLARFPSLARLLALGLVATAPLLLLALALGRAVSATHNGPLAVVGALAEGAAGTAATAWLYASVAALIRAEPA